MDNLIVVSDFQNSPYKVSVNTDLGGGTKFNDVIQEYQRIILLDVLGYLEFNKFNDDLTGITPASTEWDYFLNGTTYTHNTKEYVFRGIKPVLVKFIYYYWQRDYASGLLSSSGNTNPTYANSTKVIPVDKMVRAYNSACDDIYNTRDYAPTVYNFLDHMQIDNDYFPDWNYTKIKKINAYNL